MVKTLFQGDSLIDQLNCLSDAIYQELGNDFALIGIVTGGAHLAEYMWRVFQERHGFRPELGFIDITLYRDDLYTGLERPALGASHIDFSIDGRVLVLVDDVLFTGRTVAAAMQEIADLGRPKLLRLTVLIDRGHREFPIQADHIGFSIPTGKRERIELCFEDGIPTSIQHHL